MDTTRRAVKLDVVQHNRSQKSIKARCDLVTCKNRKLASPRRVASEEFCLCFTLLILNQLFDLASQLGTRAEQLSRQVRTGAQNLSD